MASLKAAARNLSLNQYVAETLTAACEPRSSPTEPHELREVATTVVAQLLRRALAQESTESKTRREQEPVEPTTTG